MKGVDVLVWLDQRVADCESRDAACGIGPSDGTTAAREAREAVAASLAALERIVSYYDMRRHNGRLPSFDSQAECEHEATMFGEARAALARAQGDPP